MKKLIIFIKHLVKHPDWLYLLTVIVTLLQMTYFIFDFFKPGVLKLPKPAPFLYFVILAVWVIRKEVDRWLKRKWMNKKGEFYVLIWLILAWTMVFISTISNGKYQIPSKLVETVIYVVMVYISTCFSKYKKCKQVVSMSKKVEARTYRH